MPQIDLVPVMRKAPGKCVCCQTTPMEDGRPKPAIDLNVDVDWGNNAYICAECTTVICELWGWVPEEDHEALKQKNEELEGRHARLRTRYTELRDKTERIVRGRKAEKSVRKKAKV